MKPLHTFLFASIALCASPVRAEDAPAASAAPTAPVTTPAATSVLPELPQPATSFGAALADGWLYIYGGNTGKAHEFNNECVKGDFFRLKLPDGQAWEKLPGGTALLSSSLVAHGGKVIRIGGMNARNAKGAKNDLYSTDEVLSYDPATQKWQALPPLPEPRSSHDAVVVGDLLYVGGGWKLVGDDGEGIHATWLKTLYVLDLRAPEKGWQSQPQPFERRAIATVAEGGKLWFLGGMDSADEPSRAVDWFEPKTSTWGRGPDLPEGAMAGFGIAGCATGGKVLASPLSGKISTLSADGSKWEEIAKLANPRFFHRLLPMTDGRLVAVGGSNRQGHVRALEILSLDAKAAAPTSETKGAETKTSAIAPSESGDNTWPQWRGPQRDGVSTETGWRKDWSEVPPHKLWTAQVGVGMSSPVVAGGRLITQGNDGKDHDMVIALDAATGAELWRHTFSCASTVHEMPIVPNGPGATPTVAAGHVFALSREGDLLCLDVTSGQPAWSKNLVKDLGGKRPVYGYTQSPLIVENRIFLDLGCAEEKTGSTVALDAATGEVKWRAGSGEAGYSSARVLERDGKRYVAMFKGQALDVFDPADGRVIWSHKTTARDFTNSQTPVFVGHRILVSNTGTDLAKLLDWDAGDTPNVHEVWSHKQFAMLFNNPIVTAGTLFAFNEKRRGHVEFTAIDAATGESRWVSDAAPLGTFILADGSWIFLSREGEAVLAPASATELKPTGRFQAVEGKCYATPTLANGRLYVRSNEGVVNAYDLRPMAVGTR
jgi:outer membrane protein assembly factor BamB